MDDFVSIIGGGAVPAADPSDPREPGTTGIVP